MSVIRLNSGTSKQKYKKGLISGGMASISNWEGPQFDFCLPGPSLKPKTKAKHLELFRHYKYS